MGMNDVQILEIPCGLGGLNKSTGQNYPNTDLISCSGISVEDDTWKKMCDALLITSTNPIGGATPKTVTALAEFWTNATTQIRIAATADGQYVSFGANGIVSTLASGLGTSKITTFSEMLGGSTTRKLFICNGFNTPYVTSNGTSAAALSTPPADWSGNNQPQAIVAHKSRAWGFGNANDPHRVYYSTLTNHEDFTGGGSGSISIYPGEGEKIVAGVSFGGKLWLWKSPRGIYWVNDASPRVTDWEAKRLSLVVGIAGPNSFCEADNDVYFVSTEGLIHSLGRVYAAGDAMASAILPDKLTKYMNILTLTDIQKWPMVYYARKRQVIIGCTSMLVIDLHDPQNPRAMIPGWPAQTGLYFIPLAITRDADGYYRPMASMLTNDAATIGHVSMLDEPSTFSTLGTFVTPTMPIIGQGQQMANLQWIEIWQVAQGSGNLTVDVSGDSPTQTITFPLNKSRYRKRLTGDTKTIALTGSNVVHDQGFSIKAIYVGFTAGNQRQP